MGTIASQLKALSQNTPQSSIILYLGVSPGSWVLSGREYHRQLSLFNPYSVLFQNLQLFFQMTYSHNLRRWWLLQVQSYFMDIIDYAQYEVFFWFFTPEDFYRP